VVALPVPSSETQIPLLIPSAMPQGFTRFGSVVFAMPAVSETRFVCVNVGAASAAFVRNRKAKAAVMTMASAMRARRAAVVFRNEFAA